MDCIIFKRGTTKDPARPAAAIETIRATDRHGKNTDKEQQQTEKTEEGAESLLSPVKNKSHRGLRGCRKMTDERIIRIESSVVRYLCASVSICGSLFLVSFSFRVFRVFRG